MRPDDDDAKLPPGQAGADLPHAHPAPRPDERGEAPDEADADDERDEGGESAPRRGYGEPRRSRGDRDPTLVDETATDAGEEEEIDPDERGEP